MALKATFVRTAGERDRIYVTRSDGTEVSWSYPTYGDRLPHDLVHWVVETRFGLRFGFWGRVDAGADPAAINAQANRAVGRQKFAGFGQEQGELYLAEALANAGWSTEGTTNDQLREAVAAQCRQLGISAPDLAPERIATIQSTLASLARLWRAPGQKGSLAVTFDADGPEESVHSIGGDGADAPDARE